MVLHVLVGERLQGVLDALAAGRLPVDEVLGHSGDLYDRTQARLMERRGVERLPVVDEEDRLIGIVTRRDLLRVFLRGDDEIRRQVSEEIVAGELGLPPGAVGVSVRDGVVTLAGDAELRGAIARAGFAAWRLDGVVGVVNLVPPAPPQEVARPG